MSRIFRSRRANNQEMTDPRQSVILQFGPG
jgi:hypothetical protein